MGRLTAIGMSALFAGMSVAQQPDNPPLVVTNASGLRLVAGSDPVQPRVRVILPNRPLSDRLIDVLVPEHVTGVKRGNAAAEQLFLPASGRSGPRPQWRAEGNVLRYDIKLPGPVSLSARAVLEDDGVRFEYEFVNGSPAAFDMIYAVTDPRLTGAFHDRRLERTFVHHADGFELLGSEVPSRLTLPLDRWLPARVLASFTWPVPAARVETGADGIPRYHKSRAVDLPMVVTQAADSNWLVASFSRSAGNVWSNPDLTCQHVDPQATLEARQRVTTSVKVLVMRGSMEDAARKVAAQRESLK